MRSMRAFTSIEMIVVLGMVVVIYCLLGPSFNPSRQAIVEQEFWHGMRQEWRAAQVAAQVHHQTTVIDYHPASQQIEFDRTGKITRLAIPSTLKVDRFGRFVIDDSGYTAPQTMRFTSRREHCFYLMKIQLAWGGYRLENLSA
ncbi:MAG: hypothetical protein ACLSH6_07740 [Limosilactobacillus pontis]